MTTPTDAAGGVLASVVPDWIARQTLKSVPIAGYDPRQHAEALTAIAQQLIEDDSIAAGKLSEALKCLIADPDVSRRDLTDAVFNGNSGYTLQILWPIVAIFAGRMPRKVSTTTAQSYVGWVERIRRVIDRDLDPKQRPGIEQVLDVVSDAFASAAGVSTMSTAEVAREAEDASDRVSTNEPGIYVFTTPTYLAYPPLGWNTEDPARQDFRYLKTGSTTVDVHGRIQSEIRRQTGLPEPYLILARFVGVGDNVDYVALERQIHRALNAARHGPEEDGTRRSSSRGAGTEWFITRLPLIIAVAEMLDLVLSIPEELRATNNATFEECELPDWVLD